MQQVQNEIENFTNVLYLTTDIVNPEVFEELLVDCAIVLFQSINYLLHRWQFAVASEVRLTPQKGEFSERLLERIG